MGNKFTKRRPVIDDKYTRPQGLLQHKDIDRKKLRRLILDAKLAPCYPGAEDPSADLDECPICFLLYPSLNRSKCCTKEICTECFLQLKPLHTAQPTRCPFCKTPCYSVEYRGAKTVEEKRIEQVEEQKVIEAKIRIQQKELQDEEEQMQKKEENIQECRIPTSRELLKCNFSNLHGFISPSGYSELDGTSRHPEDLHSAITMTETDSVEFRQDTSSTISTPSSLGGLVHNCGGCTTQHDQRACVPGSSFECFNRCEFDLDLEAIMVIEALWLSIQDQSLLTGQNGVDRCVFSRNNVDTLFNFEDDSTSMVSVSATGLPRVLPGRSSVTGGLAVTIAALTEQKVLGTGSAASQASQSCQMSSGIHLESDAVVTHSGIRTSDESLPTVNNSQEENIVETVSVHTIPVRYHSQLNIEGDLEKQSCIIDKTSGTGENSVCEVPCMAQEDSHLDNQDVDRGLRNWIEVSLESERTFIPETQENRGSLSDWMLDHSPETVETATSSSSSVPSASELPWEAPGILPIGSTEGIAPQGYTAVRSMMPENFNEQVVLVRDLSLAGSEAQSG